MNEDGEDLRSRGVRRAVAAQAEEEARKWGSVPIPDPEELGVSQDVGAPNLFPQAPQLKDLNERQKRIEAKLDALLMALNVEVEQDDE